MAVVVDDRLLVAVLLRREPEGLARVRRHGRLFTTGLWYHRLCRAVAGRRIAGRLSSELAGAPPDAAAVALASVIELPPEIGLLSFRELAWPMGRMVAGHRLNVVALEALCAAQRINATICLSSGNESPTLVSAAAQLGVDVTVVGAA